MKINIIYKLYLILWYSLAVMFNAVMDVIQFHPGSWLVRLNPGFMQIKDCWGMCWDGWHVSKQLMFGCLFICCVLLLKIGWTLPLDKFKVKFYLKLAAIMCTITAAIHEIFFKLIF